MVIAIVEVAGDVEFVVLEPLQAQVGIAVADLLD
jgi:hypothetical protein